jgi:hydroxyacylglutathione hydrolase
MLFKRFESKGLAHYSYLIGDQNRAVVIDPRRDCDAYVEAAVAEGLPITHILETHRNEDYVTGSVELASRTGARILRSGHSPLQYGYGERIHDGDAIQVGRLTLKALHTPGHTLGHMSYLLSERVPGSRPVLPRGSTESGGVPWIVFTGDALFAGEVGRTDFMGQDGLAEMTGLLYDSLFNKLLPLGDGVIVCPAHGAGSVCGSGIADRPWTTIGMERKYNPRLQHTDKAGFIQNVARMLPKAPYFSKMEELNLAGAPLLGETPVPTPLSAMAFAEQAAGAWVVDVRSLLSFASAHVPGAIALWEPELPAYAGWFLSYDKPILLVGETNDLSQAVTYLTRIGFDRIAGFLAGSMLAWHRAGLESQRMDTVTVQELCHRLDTDQEMWILDVRSEEEVAQNPIPDAHPIYIKQLPAHMDEVPQDRPVYVFCGSGVRSMIGASLLRRAGWQNVTVVLGGLAGWNSASCPLPL